ncbi:peptide deformylase [Saccharomonospora amisosensis]|uniref:Peptide deformylase n=1 Tax=Saccharomonospora amisosensis TaxID=1128677 RepID=A0A7X5UP34_9PSEU|nr:peptide deformylase [Saccharomonospora amisosensis]NIJ11204.1 peptide deformylase [Saccharomonospora amisosensis]
MAMRELRYFGDPVLKAVAEPVTRFDDSTKRLVDDLLDTVNAPGRAGLAAPQIGVSLRAFSYNVEGSRGYVLNPRIVELSEETHEITEGCLSVPQLWFPTVRAKRAVVRGVDLRNEPITVSGEGVMAQCLQHETDHLDGMLYLDRLTTEHRRDAMRQARQRDWFWAR